MEDSSEYKALRKSASLLRNGVGPDAIVSQLYDRGLLTPDERSKASTSNQTDLQKMDQIMVALERRVKIQPASFHTFIEVLKNVEALVPVAKRLYQNWMGENPDKSFREFHAATSEGDGQQAELVMQLSVVPPKPITAPSGSRFANQFNQAGNSPPPSFQRTSKSLLGDFLHTLGGDVQQHHGTYTSAPVQATRPDPAKSKMPLPKLPLSLSQRFIRTSENIGVEAQKGGMTPRSSRELQDQLVDYRFENEQLTAYVERLENYCTALRTQRTQEREESDGEILSLQTELEKMKLENDSLQRESDKNQHLATENIQLQKENQAAHEKTKELKSELEEKDKTLRRVMSENREAKIEKSVAERKCCDLEDQVRWLRSLCERHYDSTLQLDHKLTVVLQNPSVSEGFKSKVTELRKEIEIRKNSTWP